VLWNYVDEKYSKLTDVNEKASLLKLREDVVKTLEGFAISPRYSSSRHQKLMEKADEIFGESDNADKRKFLDFLQNMYNRDIQKEIWVTESEWLCINDLDNVTFPVRKKFTSLEFELKMLTGVISKVEEVLSRIEGRMQGEDPLKQNAAEDVMDGLYLFKDLTVGYKYFSDSGKGAYYMDVYYFFDNIQYKTILSKDLNSNGDVMTLARNKIVRQLELVRKFKQKALEIKELLDKDPIYKNEHSFLFHEESANLDALVSKAKEARSLYKENISLSGHTWADVIKEYRQPAKKTEVNAEQKVPDAKIGFSIKGLSGRIKTLNGFLDARFGVGYNKYDKYPIYMNGVEKGMALVSEDGGVAIILEGKGQGIDFDFRQLPQKVLDKIESERVNRKRVPWEILNFKNKASEFGTIIGYLKEYDNNLGEYAVIATLSGTERNTIEEMLYNTLKGADAERIMPSGDLYDGYDRFIAQKDIRASLIKYIGMDSSSDKYLAKNFFKKMYEDLEANDGVLSAETLSYLIKEDVLGFLGTYAPWDDASVLIASVKDLLVLENGRYDAGYTMKKVEVDKLRQNLKERLDINLLKK
jgi:hypothetical protein